MSCLPDETLTELGCIPNDPGGFVGRLYGIGLGLIGGVALIFIIIGGFKILTSQGDLIKLQNGKSYIMYAIAGLLFAVFGYFLIEVIAVDILRIPGFNR